MEQSIKSWMEDTRPIQNLEIEIEIFEEKMLEDVRQ